MGAHVFADVDVTLYGVLGRGVVDAGRATCRHDSDVELLAGGFWNTVGATPPRNGSIWRQQ